MPDASEIATYAKLLKLTPVDGIPTSVGAPSGVGARTRTSWRQFVARVDGTRLVLLGAIVVSVLAVVSYYSLIASDRYESESRFVIRSAGGSATNNALSEIVQNVGVSRAGDDAFVVREYLLSRDAVAFLERDGLLRRALRKAHGDFFWTFPNFYTSSSDEGLYKYYRRFVSATYDPATGISELGVSAFDPHDAKLISTRLLDAAEGLVNRLNARAKQDAVTNAEKEADQLKARVFAAQSNLTAFRTRESLLDPSQASLASLEAISSLSIEVVQVHMQITEIERTSPSAPQVSALVVRLRTLEDEILSQRRRLAGSSSSIANKIAEYERLSLEREFSERALLGAMSAVELARLDADRQQVYLERIATPSLPDHPRYPYRVLWCAAAILGGLLLTRVLFLLLEDSRRHAEP
jgi:capsular polysaccharide transport system permease protein